MCGRRHGGRLRAGPRTRVYVLALPRQVFVVGCVLLAGALLRLSASGTALLWGTAWGVGVPLLHATLRPPNLKARLANSKHDFKQMWRGYQMEMSGALLLSGGGSGGGSVTHAGVGVPASATAMAADHYSR
jgi:hypothetical protein